MDKIKVLFVCIHNSARSQMAEGFLSAIGGDRFCAWSAGIERGQLNPDVVEAMKESGLDISGKETKSVSEVIEKDFDYVITVCDEASAERCPVFPGTAQKLHWGFPDPSAISGSKDEKLEETRSIRDQIKNKIECWIKEL